MIRVGVIGCLWMLLALLSSPLQAASINFENTDIRQVIEAVSKITGKNFIIDPRVKSKVTIIAPTEMSEEDIYDTLLSILSVHGYTAVEGKTATKILPANLTRDSLSTQSSYRAEEWLTQVVDVHHVQAARLVAILRPLVAKEGHLVALAESNKLILTDRLENIRRIQAILQRVDVATQSDYEILNLRYAVAMDMAALANRVLTAEEKKLIQIVSDERANRLIVAGAESTRLKLRTLVAELDTLVPTEGQVSVIYLQYAKAAEMVNVLNTLAQNESLLASAMNDDATARTGSVSTAGQTEPSSAVRRMGRQQGTGSNISIVAEERMNALILSAPPKILQALKQVIEKLDVRRAQVMIEAIIAEVSIDQANQLGVQWGFSGDNGVGVINFDNAMINLSQTSTMTNAISSGINVAGGSWDGEQGWAALLKAISSDDQANILSVPSVVTLDNQEASMVVGREVPFQTGSYTNSSGDSSNPFQTIERKNVGISLKVTPQINEGAAVALAIEQEISDVLTANGAVDLQTSKRQISTNVIVEDGNAIVLGGLIERKSTQGESKVPLLGDIPYLGALFSAATDSDRRTNLMVFIRPKILRDDAVAADTTSLKYDYLRQMQMNYYRYEADQAAKPTSGQTTDQASVGASTVPETAKGVAQGVLPPLKTWVQQGSTPVDFDPDDVLDW